MSQINFIASSSTYALYRLSLLYKGSAYELDTGAVSDALYVRRPFGQLAPNGGRARLPPWAGLYLICATLLVFLKRHFGRTDLRLDLFYFL